MGAEKLLKRVAEGDKNAFEKLYNDYYKLVFAVAWSITRDRLDAEDVCAEVFIAIWKKSGTYNGGNGKSWICAIAKNLALTQISKRAREISNIDNETAFGTYRIENRADDKILLDSALSVLSEKERETVLMFNAGLKHREIAEITAEKLGTITWRYSEALKKMRKFLEGEQ